RRTNASPSHDRANSSTSTSSKNRGVLNFTAPTASGGIRFDKSCPQAGVTRRKSTPIIKKNRGVVMFLILVLILRRAHIPVTVFAGARGMVILAGYGLKC